MGLVITYIAIAATNSDPATLELDTAYYRYVVMPYDTSLSTLPTSVPVDTTSARDGTLRISGAKDFSFDVNQGFDQGLKVDINGEVEGVGIEGNLSDKAAPSSTVPISEIERISLKVFTKNFSGGVGNLTLELPFGITDEIRGGRIGIHSEDKKMNIAASYAINRGVFVRTQFAGEEGKQSPYFLTGPVIAGSERVYLTQGLAQPSLLARDIDYTVDYENGIVSFTNRNVITSHTRIEIEYKRAIEDYLNTYQQTDGLLSLPNVDLHALYRSSTDDKNDPLTFAPLPAELESLALAGDSARVLHTYADTSEEGSYMFQDGHFVYVGQGNGDYDVTFFYVGEGNGEYIYEPLISAFTYQGPNAGNYSPTKALPLPRCEDFAGVGAEVFKMLTVQVYGSRLDKNTFSTLDDEDNNGFGYCARVDKTFRLLSVKSNYVKYSDHFFPPTSREEIDYRYVWNTDDTLKELADLSLGLTATDFLKIETGYGMLNREHKRKFVTIRPFFFLFGYEGVDTLNRYFAGFLKDYRRVQLNARYEKYGSVQILNYGSRYAIDKNMSLSLVGGYDRDTIATGITNTVSFSTPAFNFSLGHRSLNDTTFIFGNALIDYALKGFSLHGDLQQSQRYSQKRDETYLKVNKGEGDYVYDPATNTYIKKEGGDYIRRVFLLPDFTRVITRNFGVEAGYTRSSYDLNGRFYYVDETDYRSHSEDIALDLRLSPYDIALNLHQSLQDDARYTLAQNSSVDRLATLIPSIGAFSGRFEVQFTSDMAGDIESERRRSYRGAVSYDILSRPILRPKVGYSYSTIYSQYFADLDIQQQAPSTGILFSLPLKGIRGKVETTADFIYRLYNIEEIPFFFAANEPKGLATTLGAFLSIGVGVNTVFSLIYRVEFRPDENPVQDLRLQSRIRF
jgi:hypothetical protein